MLKRLNILLAVAGVMVLVHLLNIVLAGQLYQFGIIPRSIKHLPQILTAPFIHGSASHLINNLVALLALTALCLMRSVRLWAAVSGFVILVGGGLVWLLGRNSVHVGASGWIFGLWGFLIAMAWFDRRPTSVALALLVVAIYGGMIYGVLPLDARVSFESHLFGALAGGACAFMHTYPRRKSILRN